MDQDRSEESQDTQENVNKQWNFSEARAANLKKAREKAAELRREIRNTSTIPVVKQTKLQKKLDNLQNSNLPAHEPEPLPGPPEPLPEEPPEEDLASTCQITEPVAPQKRGFQKIGNLYML